MIEKLKIKLKFLIVFTFLINGIATAQIKSGIGFRCGFAGTPSKSVILIDSLVETSNFELIRKNLFSNDNSVKCLAIIVCELIENKGLINLTDEEKNKIKEAYNSEERISLCAVCTYFEDTSMKNILNEINFDGSGINIKRTGIDRYKKMINKKTNR